MGEIFFALYLFAGIIRAIFGLSINLNILFLGLTTIFIIYKIYNQPKVLRNVQTKSTIAFILLLIVTMLSFFYSQNKELYTLKTLKLILYTTPAFIYPFLLLDNKKSLERFLLTLSSLSVFVALLILPEILLRGSSVQHIGFNNANYLSIGRTVSIGAIVLLFYNINNNTKTIKIITLISFIIVVFALFSSGSRMPILSTMFTLIISIIYLILIGKLKMNKQANFIRIAIISLGFVIVFIWAFIKGYFNTTITRFSVLLESGGGASALGRIDRFNEAFSMWLSNPILGQGFGSFGEFYANGTHDYPHNLFLEILSELGIVGIVVVCILFLLSIIEIRKLIKNENIRKSNLFMTVVAVFILTFLNSMVSGDINSNRIMFTFLSLIFVLPIIFKKNNIGMSTLN